MKYKFGYCYTFCLVNALAGFLTGSGAGIMTKYVCSGDSVQVFQHIRFNNCSSVVSLYINGERNTLIARWSFENCSRNETLLPDYKERLFLNGNGTVLIHNVHPWDQAKYIVNCQMGNISMEDAVQIIIMAAPANDCIPKILHQGSILFASLKAHSCGKPIATLYWKGYGDVPNTSEPVLKLNPGNQDGTYYACIQGPALTCVRNAPDYCSKFTIGGSGAELMTKYVCSGDSVQVFQHIRFNNCSSVVSLYINGERNTLIARWSFENCSRNETLLADYKERLFINGNGTVSIHNVHPWDQAKYIVNCQMGNISMEDAVQIIIMAAPANDCIPKILHQGSSLFASLKAHSCGKPVATLYWKGYGDVPNTSEPVLKLNAGNQDGTYYACIQGPALTCVRNAPDYCSKFTIGGSGAGIMTKYVCSGDSVQVFQHIRFNCCSSVVSLYINGERNTLIARWSFENCSRNETLLPDYKERLFLNGNRSISIHNVHPWDQAKYIVNYQMGNISTEDAVQIIIMAAPANDCIPKILHQGSILFASLKAHSCGKPIATLYWKGYGDVPNTSEPVLKLNPGNQDGTYYACIQGPALTCVRNAPEYCSKYTIGDKSPGNVMETLDVKTPKIKLLGIILGIIPILPIAVIFIRKHCRKPTSRLFKSVVYYHPTNDNARGTCKKRRTEKREVKYRNSASGSSRGSFGSEDQSDSEDKSKEATIDHQPIANVVTMREPQSMSDAAPCTINVVRSY